MVRVKQGNQMWVPPPPPPQCIRIMGVYGDVTASRGGGGENWYMEQILLIYDFLTHFYQGCTISRYWILSHIS